MVTTYGFGPEPVTDEAPPCPHPECWLIVTPLRVGCRRCGAVVEGSPYA